MPEGREIDAMSHIIVRNSTHTDMSAVQRIYASMSCMAWGRSRKNRRHLLNLGVAGMT